MIRRALRLALAAISLAAAPAVWAFDPGLSGPWTRPGANGYAATGTVEVAFSPWDDAEGAIVRAIRSARRSIHVQAFLLTSRTLTRALVEAKARGVAVEVLADREQALKMDNSLLPNLVAAGIPVALEVRYAAAHNKILIVDGEEASGAVVTGSYNFTWSAQARNAENVVILRGNPPVLRAYLDNWKRHRAEALPYAEALMQPAQ
ncbi:MAG: phospholipase D family protein [Rhodocyclales bacterium]|nr:phospholipase D family protein [Rhodocyclales bacterium]